MSRREQPPGPSGLGEVRTVNDTVECAVAEVPVCGHSVALAKTRHTAR